MKFKQQFQKEQDSDSLISYSKDNVFSTVKLNKWIFLSQMIIWAKNLKCKLMRKWTPKHSVYLFFWFQTLFLCNQKCYLLIQKSDVTFLK